MKLRYKILNGLLIFVALSIAALGLVLGHNAECGAAPPLARGAEPMQAIVYRCYGSADVLELADLAKPQPAADQALVKVHAAAVNPLDWHYMRGTPYFMRFFSGIGSPSVTRLGVDFAGTVEAVGEDIKRFQPGDRVFGGRTGAYADFLLVRDTSAVVALAANVTFEQAAGVPIAAITALQALRDKGRVQPGQKVLINGASGGVGTYAVQIAKLFGAEVTGVCSTRNVEMVRGLGADHVIDYRKENYTDSGIQYDLIVDMVGNHTLWANRRAMQPDGTLVMVGGGGGDWVGVLKRPLESVLLSPFVSQNFVSILSGFNNEDLTFLAGLLQSGKMQTVIDRRYPLAEVADAIRYSEEGHARGKIIVEMQ